MCAPSVDAEYASEFLFWHSAEDAGGIDPLEDLFGGQCSRVFFGELGCDSLGESFPVEGFAADEVVESFAVDALVFDGPCGDGFEERGFANQRRGLRRFSEDRRPTADDSVSVSRPLGDWVWAVVVIPLRRTQW